MPQTYAYPNAVGKRWHRVSDVGGATAACADGTFLKSRFENPWYILATLQGEPSSPDDPVLVENAQYFRRWLRGRLSSVEGQKIVSAFRNKTADLEVELPNPQDEINLSNIYFPSDIYLSFEGMDFPANVNLGSSFFGCRLSFERSKFFGAVDFGGSLFSKASSFRESEFQGESEFNDVSFIEKTNFESAEFFGFADFTNARFLQAPSQRYEKNNFQKRQGNAVFRNAVFRGEVVFHRSRFAGDVTFSRAEFKQEAHFGEADFGAEVDFRSSEFSDITIFDDSKFQTFVPAFHDCKMFPDILFSSKRENWPGPSSIRKISSLNKASYARLRQLMGEFSRPDDEHFFFRQEMACDAQLNSGSDKWIVQAFGWISDYGYGVTSPAFWLAVLWFVPAVVYALVFGQGCWAGRAAQVRSCLPVRIEALTDAMGFSFSNLFAFFGLHRIHFAEILKGQSDWLHFLAGFQTVFGFVFLFFLGLGLRNRFRLR